MSEAALAEPYLRQYVAEMYGDLSLVIYCEEGSQSSEENITKTKQLLERERIIPREIHLFFRRSQVRKILIYAHEAWVLPKDLLNAIPCRDTLPWLTQLIDSWIVPFIIRVPSWRKRWNETRHLRDHRQTRT